MAEATSLSTERDLGSCFHITDWRESCSRYVFRWISERGNSHLEPYLGCMLGWATDFNLNFCSNFWDWCAIWGPYCHAEWHYHSTCQGICIGRFHATLTRILYNIVFITFCMFIVILQILLMSYLFTLYTPSRRLIRISADSSSVEFCVYIF